MTPDEAIALVDKKAKGRTRYEDKHDFLDEVLVKEIKSLRKRVDELTEGLVQIIRSDDDNEDFDDPDDSDYFDDYNYNDDGDVY